MPELPEVESSRRKLDLHCVGKRVVACEATNDAGRVFNGGKDVPGDVARALVGLVLTQACRKGKHLWLRLSSGGGLWIHKAMTGAVTVRDAKGVFHVESYKEFQVDVSQWPPRHWKLALTLEDGTQWAFTNVRKFGRIRLFSGDPLQSPPLTNLAPDALNELPGARVFAKILASTKKEIKGVLLDQNHLVSGIGNWMADEILYQSRIHPTAASAGLTSTQVQMLHAATAYVVKTSCDANADASRFPAFWLFHYRWRKGRGSRGKTKDFFGHPLTFGKAGGRNGCWVCTVQKKQSLGKAATPLYLDEQVIGDTHCASEPTSGKQQLPDVTRSRSRKNTDAPRSPHVASKRPRRSLRRRR